VVALVLDSRATYTLAAANESFDLRIESFLVLHRHHDLLLQVCEAVGGIHVVSLLDLALATRNAGYCQC
jgi:hypothetical protein